MASKKPGLLILTAAMMMTALSACGGSNNDSSSSPSSAASGSESASASAPAASSQAAPSETAKPDPVTLTFTTMANGDAEAQAFKEIFENFEKATGNKVDLQILPDVAQYENIIKTRFATQDAPDIFYFFAGPNEYHNMQAEKNLVEMTSESYVGNLTSAVKDFYTVDGKIYGVPWGTFNAMGVLYNKKVYEANGLSIPKTYAELLGNAEKLKNAGITPFYEAVKTGWPTQIFPLAAFQTFVLPTIGGQDGIQQLKENKLRLKDIPELKKVFERQYDLKKKGYYNKDLLAGTYENQQEALATGTAAMAFQADWMLPEISKRFADKVNDIGFFPLPSDTDEGTVSLYPPKQIFVTKTSPRAEAATELARFMTTSESLAIWHKHNPGIPVYNGVEATLFPAQDDIYKYIQAGKGIVQIQLQLQAGFFDFDKITQELVAKGDADKAVNQMDKNYLQDGKNKKIPGF
ncbi:extracellular solute-binding protein [Cohnella ginsengisoli]|uniref:Extracellular solute-binding protein n=1 Tax=Cohnella ginsengisoli TaxID=425004 RepID=A0A9X4KF00_9BACL|nr:extracellular solute-binding protein [Cohnella ginsengisoli]MDG0790934.1 extracellular solute-binding protein [Cohnella ginsengisoli]